MTVEMSIINKVVSLEELSHTVKLCDGSEDEGSINGNILTPTVAIIPKIDRALKINAAPLKRDNAILNIGQTKPNNGAIKKKG